MTAVLLLLIAALVLAAAARLLRGGWMPIHSEHAEYDYRSLTLGGIPLEELYGPDAVRHPYPLSTPPDSLLFVDAPHFAPHAPIPWEYQRAAMLAEQRIPADWIQPHPTYYSNPS